MKILKQEYRDQISKNEMLVAKIAQATGRKISSVKRWLKDGHEMLTTITVIDVVQKELKISNPSIMMTEGESTAVAS